MDLEALCKVKYGNSTIESNEDGVLWARKEVRDETRAVMMFACGHSYRV